MSALRTRTFLLACAGGGLLIGAVAYWLTNGATGLRASAEQRSHSAHSYNEGIMRVAPSVVSVYSSETIYKAPIRLSTNDPQDPIIAPRERRSTSQGSGVIIDPSGIVLTNLHLIKDADEINVVTSNGVLHQGEVIGSDTETDLAVVRIKANNLPAVTIDPRIRPQVGDIVLAIGNPFGVGQTVTQGIISATRRRVAGTSAWQNFVQIDAAINPGNSGGALIDPDGKLLGINTAVFLRESGAEGIGFAIPVGLLAHVVPQIIANGHVIRGWLGIGADDLPMYPGINSDVGRGAVITHVLSNSPAAKAGLLPYDVVTHIGDQVIENATDLLLLVSSMQPDDIAPLRVIRKGQSMTMKAQLLKRPIFNP